MKAGDIVTVLTVAGEFVGKLVSQDNGVTLSDPRMLVQNQNGIGFASGVCMTGENEPKSVTFLDYIMLVQTNDKFEQAWRQATSGLVLP